MTRVLVTSTEPVGGRMAGPAIRALELARVLSATCDVTLAAPPGSTADGVDAELVAVHETEHRRLLGLARAHDVVVTQEAPPQLLLALARERVRIVADLYDPKPLEALEAGRDRPPAEQRTIQRLATRAALAALATADLVLCASERQRDLWLGAMAARGLIDLETYRADPTLRGLVAVVPFGVPDAPPRRADERVLARFGIPPEHRVLVWGGGVWNWLDAITPMRAVERLRERRDDVHLVFLGLRRPVPVDMGAGDEALAFARARGLLGRSVHVNEDWVPYAERGSWLLESHVGVSAHHDHVEARFAFRTRVLDYLWADLPVVGTEGDTLTDAVGRGVPAGDDAELAAAVDAVLDDGPQRDAALERTREWRTALAWPRVAEPLVAYCAEHASRPRRRRALGALAVQTLAQYPDTLARTYRAAGGAGVLRRVGRNAGRLIGVGR
jgi:glycosyltransferase involved in cell wall biosynthesis